MGVEKDVLLGTGAQVSILSDSQFKRILPQDQIRDVKKIID